MEVTPREWSVETWITVATVGLGLVVGAYGLTAGPVSLVYYGLGFVLLSVFLWVGRPRAQE